MSPYTQTLAQLRLSALQALQDALNATTDPAELRRIAQAIFRAPPPDDDIDTAIEFDDEVHQSDDAQQPEPPAPIEQDHPAAAAPASNPEPAQGPHSESINNTETDPDFAPTPTRSLGRAHQSGLRNPTLSTHPHETTRLHPEHPAEYPLDPPPE